MKVDLAGITKSFGSVVANDGISLTVEAGTIHGLLGENGAGKTTLMKILSGYQPMDAGTIRLDGHEAVFASPAEALDAGIGMLHQDPFDVPALSVLDNFSLGRGGGLLQRRRDARQELSQLCRRFGLALSPDARVGSLTVGERQQLELVRLLSLGVRLIILDEPTTGISAPQKVALFRTLRQLASEGLSIIFVSHKLEEVESLCSKATVLRSGRVAGRASAPFSTDSLVQMMFGQCLTALPRARVASDETVLELDRVTVQTQRMHLRDINLRIQAGQVVGLAGLEGSGQRTLMEVCVGLLGVRSGRVVVNGEDMTGQPYQRFLQAGVAFLPAARLEEGLIGGLTIREHVALAEPREGLFIRWHDAQARCASLIDQFSILGRPESLVRELSGGNQQRTILALLPDEVSLLVLEHPTRGLDMGSTQWVWTKLLDRRESGTAILFTSTDLDELVQNSDKIIVFSGGVMSEPISASEITCDELGYLIGGGRR